MKRCWVAVILLCAAASGARADLVRLVSGKAYQGAVIAWGTENLSFVLQGGEMKEAFAIPVAQVEYVLLPDSTVHKPGTDSWIASGHLDRLPWEPVPPAVPVADSTDRSGEKDRQRVRLAQQGARADLVRLASGKAYQGAVTAWGTESLSFVLQGGEMKQAFAIPVAQIEYVLLPDSTVHKPGTSSWIASGRIDRLPWEPERPAAPRADDTELSGKNYLLRLGLLGAWQSGYTAYRIDFPLGPYTGYSKLVFPLHGLATGFRGALRTRPADASAFQYGIDLEGAMRLTDPSAAMADSDWVSTGPVDDPDEDINRYVFSATTSTVRASSWELALSALALGPVSHAVKIGFLLGYQYLRYRADIYGVAGWQDTSGAHNIVHFSELRGSKVGQYTVSYGLPMMGLALQAEEAAQGFALQARAAHVFFATASDEDLHLLRNKQGGCSAAGSGWRLGCDARWRLKAFADKATLSLSTSYEYLTVDATGSQTQTWYGDDPATPWNDTGSSRSGIDDELTIYRHSFGVSLIYTF